MSQVAPRPVPQGKQAAGVLSKNLVPRTPFGPSETRIEGIPRRSMGVVCHMSHAKHEEEVGGVNILMLCTCRTGRVEKGRGWHTSCKSNLFIQSQLGYQLFNIPRTLPSSTMRSTTGRSIYTARRCIGIDATARGFHSHCLAGW